LLPQFASKSPKRDFLSTVNSSPLKWVGVSVNLCAFSVELRVTNIVLRTYTEFTDLPAGRQGITEPHGVKPHKGQSLVNALKI